MYKYICREVNGKLTETAQKSPVRWKLLLEDDCFLTEASQWLKCTDYFNDVVVGTHTGRFFSVYGFNNTDLIVRGDLFVAIKDFGGKALFRKNLDFINNWLKERGHDKPITEVDNIEDVPAQNYVLRIPRYYIGNTAYTSLVFMLLRACTYKIELTEDNLAKTENKLETILRLPSYSKGFDILLTPKAKEKLDELVICYKSCIGWDERTGNPIYTNITKKNLNRESCAESIHNAGVQMTAGFIEKNSEEFV